MADLVTKYKIISVVVLIGQTACFLIAIINLNPVLFIALVITSIKVYPWCIKTLRAKPNQAEVK